MKILASNPDTIGDMVLREPLYDALRRAGHELMLIVRASVAPLARYVAPEAAVVVLPTEVYRDDVAQNWDPFVDVFQKARDFQPDVLLVTPYQWTQFEEKLSDELREIPSLRRIGLSGRLHPGDPSSGVTQVSLLTFDETVHVDENAPEAEKNAALAGAILGGPIERIDPKLQPDGAAAEAANSILNRLGLNPGEFWIACVTGTANVSIKAWPVEKWGQVLGDWAGQRNGRFLLVGLPEEKAVAEEVRRAMGEHADRAAVWMDGGSLDELIALSALAAGYVGHDTGPMHIAAATGKPVLAVFGGGHRLRFVPRVTPSISLTVGVPCAGCGWACSFETSHCVKDLPVDLVTQAARDLESGSVTDRQARVIPPDQRLQARMIVEAEIFGQTQLRRAATSERKLGRAIDEAYSYVAEQKDELALRATAIAELKDELKKVTAEAAGLIEQQTERAAALEQLREEAESAQRESDRLHEEAKGSSAQTQSLREQVRALEQQLRTAAASGGNQRRNFRQRMSDWLVGTREYIPRRGVRPLPRILLAVLIDSKASPQESLQSTLHSIITQGYPRLDLVLACAGPEFDATLLLEWVIGTTNDVPPRIVGAEGGAFAAVAGLMETSDVDVIGWISPGETLEMGALRVVGEYFRDHPGATAADFEQTVDRGGWHTPATPKPALDVYELFATPQVPRSGVFLRKWESSLLGGMNPEKGAAAGWDLLLRIARRHGIRRGSGHVMCLADGTNGQVAATSVHPDFQAARQSFEETFGSAGRIRCQIIHRLNQLRHRGGRSQDRFVFAAPSQLMEFDVKPADRQEPRVSPFTGKSPDRLLFTGRDTSTSDRRPHSVYYDSTGAVAMAYPYVKDFEMVEFFAARQTCRQIPIEPPAGPSSYRGYSGGRGWERMLLQLPSPYWRFVKPTKGNPGAKRVLQLLSGLVDRGDARVRLLNVGCHEGVILDGLKAATPWKLVGVDNDPRAIEIARGKGHIVLDAKPRDVVTMIPIGEAFDVIVLSGVLVHLDDPMTVLRRLRQLLPVGGLIVFDVPNLDSKLAEWFGPTWAGWQLPFHRTFFGRAGVKRLAMLADLSIERVKTWTDPYPAAVSAALNEWGLGATIPEGASLPESAGRAGARVAGWTRTLWDWRGRGDHMYVVMKAI